MTDRKRLAALVVATYFGNAVPAFSTLRAIAKGAHVSTVRTSRAQYRTISMHLALIENFFSTDTAINPNTRPGDQCLQIDKQFDFARGKKVGRRHDLIRLKLSSPAIRRGRCIIRSTSAALRIRPNTDRVSCLRVYETRCYLAVVHQPQCAVTDGASRSCGDSIYKAAVCLDKRVKPLITLRQFQAKQFACV